MRSRCGIITVLIFQAELVDSDEVLLYVNTSLPKTNLTTRLDFRLE